MNAKERYNRIIETIEKLIQDPYLKKQDIADQISKDNGLATRDMNRVIVFLTDKLLLHYIMERRMMAAYQYLISNDEADIETAIELAGLNTHSHFDTDFKKKFRMTPKEAKQAKDESLVEPPLTWDNISCDTSKPDAVEEVEQMDNRSKFGMPLEQYERIMEATDLTELYGLDSMQSDLAFALSDKLGEPLADTFRYISELVELGDDVNSVAEHITKEDIVTNSAEHELLQFLFFKCNLPVDLAYEVMDRIPMTPEETMELDPRMVEIYAHIDDMKFSFFVSVIEYYNEQADESYGEEELNEYLDLICFGTPKEVAFQRLLPLGNADDIDADMATAAQIDSDEWDPPFERQAEEEQKWMGKRIDFEYDPDNPDYKETDEEPGYFDF